jgi:hypothetical protein
MFIRLSTATGPLRMPNGNLSTILDGVEVNIPLVADSIGRYHCPVCTYQTSNKARYQMHYMIHQPRKWQCLYCRLKFPVLYVAAVLLMLSVVSEPSCRHVWADHREMHDFRGL